MNRVFGKKKASGPPAPSLSEASSGVGNQMENLDGTLCLVDVRVESSILNIHKICLQSALVYPRPY